MLRNPTPEAARPTPTANNTESKPLLKYSLIKYTVKNTSDAIQNHFKYFIQLNYKIIPPLDSFYEGFDDFMLKPRAEQLSILGLE